MRGHEHIIELRKKGLLPESIFIEDYLTPFTDWFEYNEYPHVCVDGDTIETLDLRFLLGTVVHISTESESRGKALLNACIRHGARTVIACQTKKTMPERNEVLWMEVFNG
jgi:hypothetical protein